jgi:uncharacterized protein (DUF111 family)
MGRLLLFDAFNGVSGDMILGAMVDLGLPLDYLETRMKPLGLSDVVCAAEKTKRRGILGSCTEVMEGTPIRIETPCIGPTGISVG